MLFIDESFSKNYILVGHLVGIDDVTRLRKSIKSHVLSGQRSIHFVKENESRKKYLLSQFQRLGCKAIWVEILNDNLRDARLKAIDEFLALTGEYQIGGFVIELDETTFISDRTALNGFNKAAAPHTITFDFKSRHEEPLLWVADAVAWSLGRGGVWKTRVQPLVVFTNEFGR